MPDARSFLYFASGDLAGAEAGARQFVANIEERGSTTVVPRIRLAQVLIRRYGGHAAEEIQSELALAEAICLRPGGPRIHLPEVLEVRADLARVQGAGDVCTRYLREALVLFESMGATGHAARVQRMLDVFIPGEEESMTAEDRSQS